MIPQYILELEDIATLYLFETKELRDEARLYCESQNLNCFAGQLDTCKSIQDFKFSLTHEFLKKGLF